MLYFENEQATDNIMILLFDFCLKLMKQYQRNRLAFINLYLPSGDRTIVNLLY